MSFEQHWALERCRREDVIAAVLAVADRHDLRFWAHSEGDEITVWVQFPVDGAAELAHAISDLYTSADEAAHELGALEGEVDMEAAIEAGAAERIANGWTLPVERTDEFRRPAPARYTCVFDIDWERDEPVVVYSNDRDNRAGWPLIVAFADAVATALGGSWADP